MRRVGINYVDDGYCQRPFDEERDGWLDEQLPEHVVPSLQIAKDIIALYQEVNELRRENWQLKKQSELYEKSLFPIKL